MFTLQRTTSESLDFQYLIRFLDENLKSNDGDDHPFYAQFNGIDQIRNVVVCYADEIPIGCGAFKEYNTNTVEIKRMFVQPNYRGKGVASSILSELELWAKAIGYSESILETGIKQVEAVLLYSRKGYTIIPNYEPYTSVENSICFKKSI
jgi:GNAT superfamily N-acetyltransferase